MTADVYTQKNKQSETSGVLTREWVYEDTIPCKIEPLKASSGAGRFDNKSFDVGKHNVYDEKLQLKMKCLTAFSKRWRISGIRTSDGQKVYTEIDKITVDNNVVNKKYIMTHATCTQLCTLENDDAIEFIQNYIKIQILEE